MALYLTLLRAVNLGPGTRIAMADLRSEMSHLGYENVKTYINSGNILFDSSEPVDDVELTQSISDRFGFAIPTFAFTGDKILELVTQAPDWWCVDDGGTHNALFTLSENEASLIMATFSSMQLPADNIQMVENVIFWSSRAGEKSGIKKATAHPLFTRITMRTANTTKKLAYLIKNR